MKKIIIISLIAGLGAIYGCKNPCKGVITYTPIDNRLLNYVFKPGSYWVYRDSIDGITDSQYVYSYTHITHYEYLNPDTIKGVNHNDCLAPLYTDYLQMQIMSFYNNVFNDTLAIAASAFNSGGTINTLSIYEYYDLSNQIGIPTFILDYTKIGLYQFSPIDSSSIWYEGTQNTISSGPYTFSNVIVFRIQIAQGNSTRYNSPTDLYFAAGYGIVKIVEHRTTGDINHDLINYKIIN